MSSNAIAGAVVFAKNLAAVARFYEVVLRADVVHAGSDHVVLATGATQLVIHAIPPHVARDIVVDTPPVLRVETPIKLFFTVSRLSEVRAKAPSLGGGLAPASGEWSAPGFRACDGWDPEGNVVQFREDAV